MSFKKPGEQPPSINSEAIWDFIRSMIRGSPPTGEQPDLDEAEKRIAEWVGLVQLLQDIAVASNEAVTVEATLKFALDRVCDHTRWPVGHVYLPTKDNKGQLLSADIWHLDESGKFESFQEITQTTRTASSGGLPGRVFATGKPVWIMDVTQDPDFRRAKLSEEIGVKAGFAFPVWVGSEVVAVLEFFSAEAIEPAESLLEVMAHVGMQLGRVIERKRAEKALRAREVQLADAQRLAHLGSWNWNITTNEVTWSDELYRIYGLTDKEFEASFEGYLERIHPDDRNFVRKEIEKAYDSYRPFNFEHRIMRPDGTIRSVQARGKVVRDEAGRAIRMFGSSQDITERRDMERDLAEVQHRLMESRENERLQIAQELHDGPLQDLHGASYQLNEIWDVLADDTSRGQLITAQVTIQRVIKVLRAICGELRPPTLAPFGLEKAIRSHAEHFQKEHPELSVELNLMADGQTLPEPVRLALFRIYQQAVHNILKHAQAGYIAVRFVVEPTQIILEIQDDGCGFKLPKRRIDLARQGHLGIVGATERAEATGGRLEIVSMPDQGTLIRAIIPRSTETGV